jgi:hypothetical protein
MGTAWGQMELSNFVNEVEEAKYVAARRSR